MEQRQKIKKVMIGTPALDGRLEVLYAYSLGESIRVGLADGYDIRPLFISNDALIQRARNDIMYHAYNSNIDCMVWIDSDEFWEWSQLKRLIDHPYDFVGGTARRKTPEESYVVRKKPGKMKINKDGLIEVNAVGTGFLKMSKKAIDKVWKKSKVYSEDNNKKDKRMVFEIGVNKEGNIVGEDVMLCDKWRAMKGKVYLDPDITVGHIGTVPFIGDFKKWADVNELLIGG